MSFNLKLQRVAPTDGEMEQYKAELTPLLKEMRDEEKVFSHQALGYVTDVFKDFESNLERIYLFDFTLAFDGQNNIVGFLSHTVFEKTGEVYISLLYVVPRFRRFGIGRALIRSLLGSLTSGTEIELTCQILNDAALKFYNSLGFKQTLVTYKKMEL